MTVLAIAVVVLLLLSAYCSMAEAALLAVPISRVRGLVDRKIRGSRRLLRLKEDIDRSISGIVILNNIANVAGTALVATLAAQHFDDALLGAFIGLLTLAVVLIGEIVPKTIGARNPERVSLNLVPLTAALLWLLHPVLGLVKGLTALVNRGQPMAVVTEDEIKHMATLGHSAGVIQRDEKELIHNIFAMNDITADDVMTPRLLVEAYDATLTVGAIRDDLTRESLYSRIPLYERSLDRVVGILLRNDALVALARGRVDVNLRDLAKPPLFVPTAMRLDLLLKEFQRHRTHLAIVVDEYGVTAGVVTLEDLLEEIVGEIADETDVDETLIKRLGKNEVLVHGLTRVSDVNRFLNLALADHRTVMGLMQDVLGRIPQKDDRVELGGVDLTVVEADERAVRKVRIVKK